MRDYKLQLTPTKNTINRNYMESQRLKKMVDVGIITKKEAVILFNSYLEQVFGRKLK